MEEIKLFDYVETAVDKVDSGDFIKAGSHGTVVDIGDVEGKTMYLLEMEWDASILVPYYINELKKVN